MKYLLVYAATILATELMNLDLSLQLMKDIADEGYRIDSNKTKELYSCLSENVKKQQKLFQIVPIVNVIYAVVSRLTYETQRDKVLTQLRTLGVIEEMTEEEKKEYEKKPTRINAILVMARSRANTVIAERTKEESEDNEVENENNEEERRVKVTTYTVEIPNIENKMPTRNSDSSTLTEEEMDEGFRILIEYMKKYENSLGKDYSHDKKELKELRKTLIKAKKQYGKDVKRLKKINRKK